MGKVVIAIGIRGVGKSSVLEKVAKRFKGLKVMAFSEEMMKVCAAKGMPTGRDDLRKIPSDVYVKLKNETWEHLASQKENIIVDTHGFVEHTGRYIPGLPLESIKKFKDLRGFFIVDADNDTIRARSARDKSRIREGHSDFELNDYRYANLAALSYYSTSLNIPFYVVFNEDGKLDQAVDIFTAHLKDAFGEK